MTDSIDSKLAARGITLPTPAAPVAAYTPVVISGGMAYLSGQLPFGKGGDVMTGRLGETADVETGRKAAEACGVMVLAQLKAALGSLDRVERIVRLGVFVSSADDFTQQPKVADGASQLMLEIFGDAGRHARSAVGVPVLPLGAMVEVDAVVAIRG